VEKESKRRSDDEREKEREKEGVVTWRIVPGCTWASLMHV
jgi:hypothetical protein